jgi:hypothetical protein
MKKIFLKNNFSSNEAKKFLGRSDFGGSVGKGKQTKFHFRPGVQVGFFFFFVFFFVCVSLDTYQSFNSALVNFSNTFQTAHTQS